jgi:ADP-heptose:LPS heptosyltransferase
MSSAPFWPKGMRRRWWLFRLFDLIARHWPVAKKPSGLVVVRMDGIGDMVLFRRTLDHYAQAFGVAKNEITVVGCRSWGGIAPHVFAGYKVHAIDEHRFERDPLYRLREALWLRKESFAIAVCDMFFRKALTADSLVWLSGAPRKVTSKPYVSHVTKPEFDWYQSQVSEIIDTGDYPIHETIRHFRFVSQLAGREIAPEIPKLDWPDNPPPVEPGPPYVILNFGSNEPGRRWPFAKFIEVADRLLDSGYRVAFTGGNGEVHVRPELSQKLDRPGVIDLIGRTNLSQLLDLMAHTAATISNDTGPAHLSIALGAPTLVLVGGGHFGSFVPYALETTPPTARFVHQEMDCYHCFWRCSKPRDRKDSFPCVGEISTEAALKALGELIDLPPRP